jgi:ATP-binding cassette subfamily B protein
MLVVSTFFGFVPLFLYVATSIFAGEVAADPGGVRLELWVPFLALLVLFLQGADPVLRELYPVVGRRLDFWVQRRVMAAALAPDTIGHLDTPELRDATALARDWSHSAFPPGEAVTSMFEVYRACIVGVGSGLLLATFQWWLPLAVAPGYVLMTVLGTRGRSSDERVRSDTVEPRRRAEYLRDQAYDPASGREARVFGLGRWFEARAHRAWLEGVQPAWAARRAARSTAVLTIVVLIGGHLLALALIMAAAIEGRVDVAQAALYLQGVSGLVNFWFPWHVIVLREATRPLAAVNDLPDVAVAEAQARLVPPRFRGDVAFDAVTFRYPGRPSPVLDDFDLRIEAGTSLAIVGVNGAGKTTLVKVLAGLLDPEAGTVRAGGADIRTNRRLWQSQVAAIFQDFVRYPFSARDNVIVGDPWPDDGAARRAIDRSMADHVVDALEGGLDAHLGREFDGVDLSGGQWQRLALARALYAVERGASVLVLDEPTAQLDVRAEAALFDRFLELTRGVTTILISHRFSSVRHAQRIVVLDEGRVLEDGTHESLVEAGGRYARLFSEQARQFEPVAADA